MKILASLLTAFLVLFVVLLVPASAEVVGKLTQVEGTVDFLKGGKLPATAAKLEDGVEVGDVLRTKSLSKAQITFMDNTVITVSPESRIAIEEYMFNPGQGKRNGVVQLFQGLAHVVVTKLFKPTDPDFVVKTHTAVMGVRGTDFGVRLHPNSSTILNFDGHTEVGNIFPEVGDLLFKKTYKIAFSWGGASSVHLRNMQGTTVVQGLPPSLPFTITDLDHQMFMRQMSGAFQQGMTSRATGGNVVVSGGGGGGGTSGSSLTTGDVLPAGSNLGSLLLNNGTTLLNQPIITPNPTQQVVTPPTPTPTSFSFTETFAGGYSLVSTTLNVGTFTNTNLGSGSRTGVYSGLFSTSYLLIGTGPPFAAANTGTISATSITGTVTGILGQTLTGTITIPNLITSGGTAFSLTGPVTLNPNGTLTANNLTGSVTLSGVTGTVTGSWNQVAALAVAQQTIANAASVVTPTAALSRIAK